MAFMKYTTLQQNLSYISLLNRLIEIAHDGIFPSYGEDMIKYIDILRDSPIPSIS
jgi:hypothetical protein